MVPQTNNDKKYWASKNNFDIRRKKEIDLEEKKLVHLFDSNVLTKKKTE